MENQPVAFFLFHRLLPSNASLHPLSYRGPARRLSSAAQGPRATELIKPGLINGGSSASSGKKKTLIKNQNEASEETRYEADAFSQCLTNVKETAGFYLEKILVAKVPLDTKVFACLEHFHIWSHRSHTCWDLNGTDRHKAVHKSEEKGNWSLVFSDSEKYDAFVVWHLLYCFII